MNMSMAWPLPASAPGAHDLVVRRPEGLYCPAGDFHIDPWRPVPRAVITHAHADHARRGHGAYLTSAPGIAPGEPMIDKPLPITGQGDDLSLWRDGRFWGGLLILLLLATGAVYRARWEY